MFSLVILTSFIQGDHEKRMIDIDSILKKMESPHLNFLSDYEAFLKSKLDSTKTVGAAVAIVSHDSLIFINSYGVRIAGTSDSVDLNTVFRLASVSKGFAGVLACMLQEDSIISLDEKILNTIPDLKLRNAINTKELTLKHTLNHTSGLAPHAFDNLIESGWSMSSMINHFPEIAIAAPPGQVYAYQNVIFSLIDTILKVKTGKSYSEFLNERIFTPLGMTDASLDFQSMLKNNDIAYPHQLVKGKYVPLGLNPRYYNVAPAAGVNASISDMAKWLKALLGLYPNIVDSSILDEISTPLINTPLKKNYTLRWGEVDNQQYSLGWRIFRYMGHDIIYHGGYVKGYRAEIAYCPAEKTGIVFLQNSPNALAAESVPEFWKRYFAFIDSYKVLADNH